MYGCYFYNIGYTVHFDSYDEAYSYGSKSGFQFSIIDINISYN